jgi:Flp pilus assembly pilin Flp
VGYYRRLRNWPRDNRGQGLIEYALLAGLVSIAAVIALQAIGPQLNGMVQLVTQAFP